MATHDEFELRIVEVKGSLPVEHTRGPAPAVPQPRRAPTSGEALEAVRSMKGAASVIERIPMLGDTTLWTEVAFWSPGKSTGAAQPTEGGLFLWHCDFPPFWDLADAMVTYPPGVGVAYFAGTDLLAGPGGNVAPPAGPLSGQVWCYLDVAVPGFYLFVAQVTTYSDYSDSLYTATIECSIDTSSLGTVTITGEGEYSFPFLVALPRGLHRFQILQVTGALYFVSLTAWFVMPLVGLPQIETHDESELRIVEVKGSLPVEQMRGPVPALPQPRGAPTPAEALEAVRSMKGAATVIERLPMLGNTVSWTEVAFWSPLKWTGAAPNDDGFFVWHCDFYPIFDLGAAYSNPVGEGTVYFAGEDLLAGPGGGVAPPAGPLSGQVWCYLDVAVPGFYLFVAQVSNASSLVYPAAIECWIDTSSLGTVTLSGGGDDGALSHPFVVALPSGLHRFVIQQVTGAMYFQSLTAWFVMPWLHQVGPTT